MKPLVRIGKIEDPDRWRRDDLRAMTPNQRVRMLLKMQESARENPLPPMERIVHIKRYDKTS